MLAAVLLVTLAAADAAVARVGDHAVSADEVKARAAVRPGKPPAALASEIANEWLLADLARARGLAKAPSFVEMVERERRRLAAERLLATEVDSSVHVTDAQIAQEFAKKDRALLDVVYYPSSDAAAEGLKRLEGGGTVAAEAPFSADKRVRNRPAEMTRGQMPPALAQAVFSAPLQRFMGPVKLQLGYAVLRVHERFVPDEAQLARDRDGLRKFLEDQVRTQVRAHYVAQLRAKHKIAIDEAFLEKTGESAEVSGAAGDHVVAQVGSRAVRYRDVVAGMAKTFGSASAGHVTGPRMKAQFAGTLAEQLLVEEIAIGRGLDRSPQVTRAVAAFERGRLAAAIVDEIRAGIRPPSPDEVERYYREHAEEFRSPPVRRCAHVLVGDEAVARAIADRARKGERFDKLAAELSLDAETSARGGALPDLSEEALRTIGASDPEVARAIRGAKPGETTAPVKSFDGWHVFRCEAWTQGGTFPLEPLRANLSEKLFLQRVDAAVGARVADLRKVTPVTVDEIAARRALAE